MKLHRSHSKAVDGARRGLLVGCLGMSVATIGAVFARDTGNVGVIIKMTDDFRFEPEDATILANHAVEWRNESHFSHVVTDDPKIADTPTPSGPERFSSGVIAPGTTYRHVFSKPGSYRYVCVPHQGIGMVGQLKVLSS